MSIYSENMNRKSDFHFRSKSFGIPAYSSLFDLIELEYDLLFLVRTTVDAYLALNNWYSRDDFVTLQIGFAYLNTMSFIYNLYIARFDGMHVFPIKDQMISWNLLESFLDLIKLHIFVVHLLAVREF